MWWAHSGAKPVTGISPSPVPIYYRIKLEQVTGRCGAFDIAPDAKQFKSDADAQEWLHNFLKAPRPA
jgi:hypothetical protein